MKRIRPFALLGLAVLLLSGCKFMTFTELYISDAELLGAGKVESIPANISIAIEMPSEEKCLERSKEIVDMLGQYFAKAKFDRCASEGINDFLSVKAQVQVIRADKLEKIVDQSHGFMFFVVRKNGNGLEVFPFILRPRYDQFRGVIKQRYGMDIETDDLELNVVLRNDAKAVRVVNVCSAYIDRQPVPMCGSITLSGREYIDVLVSDIQAEYLVVNGFSEQPLMTISREK